MANLNDRIRDFWNEASNVYDAAPSHNPVRAAELAAWRAALVRHLPAAPAKVLDVGAGTGSISLLAAELGFTVTSLDLAPQMLEKAREKAAERGLELQIVVGSATEPPAGPFDAVVERHVLWTLPDPTEALAAWRAAVTPAGGRLVAYEGVWGGEGHLHEARSELIKAVRAMVGGPPDHGRYAPEVTSELPLAQNMTAEAVLEAAAAAGWRRLRLERLRDVEWAEAGGRHPALRQLEAFPRFAVLAEA